MIAKYQGVKEKHISPYIEYESPVCYCRKVICGVQVFLNVGQRSLSRSRDQNYSPTGKVLS